MNEKKILKDINEFENNLKNKLNEKKLKPMECYLLKNNSENNLLNNFNNKKYINLSSHPEINKNFIDNFSTAIKFLQNDGKISYVDKNIMESIFNKEEINKINISQIYDANNKIIIDFQGNDSPSSILLINPFEKIRKIFIILFENSNRDKKEIFECLLLKNIINIDDIEKIKEKYLNYLIKFEDYIKIIKINENDIKEILQILILLYYYEKYLSKEKYIFNEYQSYYLINQNRIESYKNFYHYYDLMDILKEYSLKNNEINFLNIGYHINNIVENCYKKYTTYNIPIGFQKNIKHIDSLISFLFYNKNDNNIEFYNDCYIIPSKIIDKIIKFEYNNKNISLLPHKIFSKNENIFLLLDSKNIINVGNIDINKTLLFKNKYIFFYNSEIIYKNEKNELSEQSLEMYIKQKSCNENTFEVQLMKNKEGDNIGKFFKLNTNSYNYRKLKKNFYISKTYKKLYHTGNKIQKNYTKNNIMKEKQNDSEITNKEQNFNVKYLGDIENKSEFSKNF